MDFYPLDYAVLFFLAFKLFYDVLILFVLCLIML